MRCYNLSKGAWPLYRQHELLQIMGKKKSGGGKKSGKKKSGKKKKTAEPQPTWKEALLAYQYGTLCHYFHRSMYFWYFWCHTGDSLKLAKYNLKVREQKALLKYYVQLLINANCTGPYSSESPTKKEVLKMSNMNTRSSRKRTWDTEKEYVLIQVYMYTCIYWYTYFMFYYLLPFKYCNIKFVN